MIRSHHMSEIGGLIGQFFRRIQGFLFEPAWTMKLDPDATREFYARHYKKFTTACGAEWADEDYGNVQLLDAHGAEDQIMMVELFERYKIRVPSFCKSEKCCVFMANLAAIAKLHFRFAMYHLEYSRECKCEYGCMQRIEDSGKDGGDTVSKESDQCGNCAGGADGFIN